MNSSFFKNLVLLLVSALSLLGPSYTVSGSECAVLSYSIVCNGDLITDSSLQMLSHRLQGIEYRHFHFQQLIITETMVTQIPSGLFGDIVFENVLIEGNHQLGSIQIDAFTPQQVDTLFIISNPLLSDNNVYRLIDRLQVKIEVDFDFDSLKEVPSNAFSRESKLDPVHLLNHSHHHHHDTIPANIQFRKLVLSNNKIEKIKSNAFHSMFHCCREIFLNHNKLQSISSYGFNLTSGVNASSSSLSSSMSSFPTLHINLDHNSLTSESFHPNFLHLPQSSSASYQADSVILNLSYNQLTKVDESIFKPLLESSMLIAIDFTENPLKCHEPEMDWLINNRQYFSKTIGLGC